MPSILDFELTRFVKRVARVNEEIHTNGGELIETTFTKVPGGVYIAGVPKEYEARLFSGLESVD